jgi:CRISPR-associated Cas5-like protein
VSHRNSIEFKVSARHALFTDPLTRIGGEKCSYHLPTYEVDFPRFSRHLSASVSKLFERQRAQ